MLNELATPVSVTLIRTTLPDQPEKHGYSIETVFPGDSRLSSGQLMLAV